MMPCAASSAQRSSFLSAGTPVGAEQLGKSQVVPSDWPHSLLKSPGEPPLFMSECWIFTGTCMCVCVCEGLSALTEQTVKDVLLNMLDSSLI